MGDTNINDATFAERHWGDVVGLLILYSGVLLVLCAPFYGTHSTVSITGLGNSLVVAGVGLLKLRTNPKGENGNATKKNGNDVNGDASAVAGVRGTQ